MNFQNEKFRTWLSGAIFVVLVGELTSFTQLGKDCSDFFLRVFDEREELTLPAQTLHQPIRLVPKLKSPNYFQLDIQFVVMSEPTQNTILLETNSTKDKLKIDLYGPFAKLSFIESSYERNRPSQVTISNTIRPNRVETLHLYVTNKKSLGGYFSHGLSFQTKQTVPIIDLSRGVQFGGGMPLDLIKISQVRVQFGRTVDTRALFVYLRCFMGMILMGLLYILLGGKVKNE